MDGFAGNISHKMVKFDIDMYPAESSTIMEAQWVEVWDI